MDSSTQEVSIDPELIRRFSQKRKAMYDAIFKDHEGRLEYIKRGTTDVEVVQPTTPKFEIIREYENEDKIHIEVTPIDLGNWMSGSRTIKNPTAITLICDKTGDNVIIKLQEDSTGKVEEMAYSGHITDLVDNVTLLEDDDINP